MFKKSLEDIVAPLLVSLEKFVGDTKLEIDENLIKIQELTTFNTTHIDNISQATKIKDNLEKILK